MGFSLADIIRILENYGDKEKLEAFLLERQNELKKLSEDTQYKLMLLETAQKRLRREQTMSYDATATAMSWMKDNGYTMNGPMFCIYHVSPAQTTNPDELVTEICFPVK